MKLSVTIAGKNALPSAFVVWRGFKESIIKAKQMGYDGVELALKSPDEISLGQLTQLTEENNISISCITTGQVFADNGLCFTSKNPADNTLNPSATLQCSIR